MALEKHILIGHIGVLPDGILQIRQDTIIIDDGVEISKSYYRWCLAPGDDLSTSDQRIKDIATLLWTPEVIAAHKAKLAQLQKA